MQDARDRTPPSGTPSAEVDAELNPHREEEQARAREHNLDVLGQRGVPLFGDETDEELADLWSAVDRFEFAVEARGGDTFTNAPDSSEPDNPDFVLPERKPGESVVAYVHRIIEAGDRLLRIEPGPGPEA